MISNEDVGKFVQWLKLQGVPFQTDVSLARMSQIKAGGMARLLLKPENEIQCATLMHELKARQLPYRVIGNLSNIIFRDGEIKTVLISTRNLRHLSIDGDGLVSAGAGVMLPTLAKKLSNAGYRGFTGLIGVPASIGGAIFMNASCYGDAISDYLVGVRCVDGSGQLFEFRKEELMFSWRHSAFHDHLYGWTIISAQFRPVEGDDTEGVREEQIRRHRRTFQESTFPNLGSTFATTNIYGELASRFLLYRMGLLGIKLIAKLSGAKRDHMFASLARAYTMKYFGLNVTETVGYSDSTFNCVVNKGGAKADDIIEFVLSTHKAINRAVPLEIELLKEIE